jgi:crotonobetainyl-CoA:carnitine CoA-transferase CaiB-like acyl-CoA transferase
MVFEDEQVVHREMLRHLPHPLSGTVPQVVSPLRFTTNPLDFSRPPPLLGQHTDEVLNGLQSGGEAARQVPPHHAKHGRKK